MRRLEISWSPSAWDDYHYWQKTDSALLKRINILIEDCARGNGAEGIGKPEQLRHDLSGLWSRRINHQHRLVYRITESSVVIISARYHY